MNAGLKFVHRDAHLKVETAESPFTRAWTRGATARMPVAHHEGNYIADDATLARLKGEGRIAFTYCLPDGSPGGNPNGAMAGIAGIRSENRRVLGMIPHPERAADPALGGTSGEPDGARLFRGLIDAPAAP